eukprot:jgi/Psemu1/321592/estExt_fgenesh1_pg.C_50056
MADAVTVVKDSVYSFELARRAVGRAALHLGIDSMTEQALDVMADILLQHLTRTGQALSHLAESSRRTSAHVNVFDAFQACQLVTSPAVGRLHLQEPEDEEEEIANGASSEPTAATTTTAVVVVSEGTSPNGIANSSSGSSNANSNAISNGGGLSAVSNSAINNNGGTTQPNNGSSSATSQSSTGWKGLASFVFDNANGETGEGEASAGGPAGGKVFPSSIENGDAGGQHGGAGDIIMSTHGGGGGRRRKRRGWDAPYPDGVPLFPRASASCANPHALPAKLTGGLSSGKATSPFRKVDVDADEAAEQEQEALDELEALPDDVFVPSQEDTSSEMAATNGSSWGSLDAKHKRKLDSTNNNNNNNNNNGQQDSNNNYTKDQDGDVDMESANKKIKVADGSTKREKQNGVASTNTETGRPSRAKKEAERNGEDDDAMSEEFLYIPSFYPRPPSTKVVVDDCRTVVDIMDEERQRILQQTRTQHQQEQQISGATIDANPSGAIRDTITIDSSQGVRTSLVRLGNSYWGSGWDQTSSSASAIAVPMGRKMKDPASTAVEDPIVPMSRASGSRVSRVLEGSMDAAAMQ